MDTISNLNSYPPNDEQIVQYLERLEKNVDNKINNLRIKSRLQNELLRICKKDLQTLKEKHFPEPVSSSEILNRARQLTAIVNKTKKCCCYLINPTEFKHHWTTYFQNVCCYCKYTYVCQIPFAIVFIPLHIFVLPVLACKSLSREETLCCSRSCPCEFSGCPDCCFDYNHCLSLKEEKDIYMQYGSQLLQIQSKFKTSGSMDKNKLHKDSTI